MSSFHGDNISFIRHTQGQWMSSPTFQQGLTEQYEDEIESSDVVQGRIFWLAAKEELPDRAVRRAHGKGAIEDGIYNHPVVVVSRPANESRLAHFELITSLGGKTLDQMYNKPNDFHASRRSWYLPISPSPDHPDANSKKLKKRFPSLNLTDSATLRWNSYVNIRHVYKIDWSLLKPYSNPDTPYTRLYRFDRESTIRLLAKTKILTLYEPSLQHQDKIGFLGQDEAILKHRQEATLRHRSEMNLKRWDSEPLRVSTRVIQTVQDRAQGHRSSSVDETSMTSTMFYLSSSPLQSDFRRAGVERYQIVSPQPKVPPDPKAEPILTAFIPEIVQRPIDRLVKSLQQLKRDVERNGSTMFLNPNPGSRAANNFWRDVKGVTAVFIASI